jgi:transcriptional regulator with XRE-family HTH domain
MDRIDARRRRLPARRPADGSAAGTAAHSPQTAVSMPLPAERALRKLGRDLALARRKRGIATSDMAARLFVSRDTLWRLERGDPTVALGTLVTATFILNLHDRLANLAAPASDDLGLSLDERRLPQRIRRPNHELGSPY